ncbi:MAG: Dyp-type peroxidase [Corynebacterium glucuronolyticum]|nr:Dyp-type peroxidase [Corynebacterium glucuronolyticum]
MNRRDVFSCSWLGVVLVTVIIMAWTSDTLTFSVQEVLGGTLSIVAMGTFWISTHMPPNTRKQVTDGLNVAIVIGWLVYPGITTTKASTFIFATGLLLVAVATVFGDIREAGVLPGRGMTIYDTSSNIAGHIPFLDAKLNVNFSPTYLRFIGSALLLLGALLRGLSSRIAIVRNAPDDPFLAIVHPDHNGGHRSVWGGYKYTESLTDLGRLDTGLFFNAVDRDPSQTSIPILQWMATDHMAEYLQHTASAMYLIPPGIRDSDSYIGQRLLEA